MKRHSIRQARMWVAVMGGLVLAWPRPGWAESNATGTDSTQAQSPTQEQPTAPAAETRTPTTAEESAPAPAPDQAAANSAAPAPASSSESGGLISVDFKDADIRQVLRVIALKSGVDIVAGNDVDALVTIKLTDVPWEEALDIILRTYGFSYERKGHIVRVLTLQAMEQEALSTEVFPLNYAKAKEVPDIIKEMLSERGRIKYDERTNTIIVTDIASNLFQTRKVIERLDQRTPQVLVETRVIETRLTKEENLGIDWTKTLTTDWIQTIPDIQSSFPFKPDGGLGPLGKVFGAQRAPSRTSSTLSLGTLTTPDLKATINILQSRTDTHIISNPSIAVLNNQSANVHIGQDYPIPNYTIDPTTGKATISGYQSKSVGTVLTVTPHVNPSNEIVVELKPEITTADANGITYSTGGGAVTLPLFTTQTAQTQVRIRDTETIVIGGLIKKGDQHTQTKVPILGDLPILGLLFKTNRWYSGGSDPNRQDLLIFLTVKLMQESPLEGGRAVASVPELYQSPLMQEIKGSGEKTQ